MPEAGGNGRFAVEGGGAHLQVTANAHGADKEPGVCVSPNDFFWRVFPPNQYRLMSSQSEMMGREK